MTQKLTDKYWPGAALIALIGLFLKLLFLAYDAFPFNSDEAVVALMARHILGGQWPAFFYGQAYMGSLDATLIAAGFAIFGEEVWVIRLIQSVLYFATIMTASALAWSIYRDKRIAWVAAALLAIPTVNVMLYTTVSLGGYGEALLIGNLLMLLALQVWREEKGHIVWGLLAGLGFWAFGITLVFSVPTGIMLTRRLWRSKGKLIATGVAIVVGALPWIVSGFQQGYGSFFTELFGEAISGASTGGLRSVLEHLINLGLFGPTVVFGLRTPWSADLIAGPLAPLVLALWLIVIGFGVYRLKLQDDARVGRWMLAGVVATLLVGFVITPFGGDPSGRYFIPLAVPLALIAGEFVIEALVPRVGKWAYGAVALLLAFNLWGSIRSAAESPPGITTQFDPVAQIDHSYLPDLIEFLEDSGEHTGYTNYWITYPLAFHSDERLIFVPRLPYHQDFRYTERDDRYEPYQDIVAEGRSVAFITTNFPMLDQAIGEGLEENGIDFSYEVIGPYSVFYGLSRAIHPEELGVYRSQ